MSKRRNRKWKTRLKGKKVITTLFFIVLADMFGFGLIIPLLPYYVEQLWCKRFDDRIFVYG